MPDWEQLTHAYGSAENIPELLSQLSSFPEEDSCEQEPWFSLWSALYHQGDIYSASFAAAIEIIGLASQSPHKVTYSFLALPAAIEVARVKNNIVVPTELRTAYFNSIEALATAATSAAKKNISPLVHRAATSAFAASIGQYVYADLILEIPPDEISQVMEWYLSR